VNVDDLGPELAAVLPAHLARQRWFGAKDRPGVELRLTVVEELQPPWPGLLRVVVEATADLGGPARAAGAERYQLVLGLRHVDDPALPAADDAAVVGVLATPAGPAVCFDGLADPALGLALLHRVAPTHRAETARPVGAEQSNTSLVYDERLILKVFRRLSGSNPEIEVTLGLAREQFTQVPEPLAVWRADGDDLAVLQRFLAGGVEGWALALTSLRDLLDDGVGPADAGGDLGPEAERLGHMTAELHLALARAFGAGPGDAGAWADSVAARAASVRHPDLDRAAVRRAAERLASLDDVGASVRIHGDYHLGQVMRTDDGWFVLDFEGEPARPVEERRTPSSPLRDVAGMLRSFSYAAAVGLREHGRRGEGHPELDLPGVGSPGRPGPVVAVPSARDLACAWEQRNREAFLRGYLEGQRGSALLPRDPAATMALLHAFELDKAVYEVAYEQAHRPDWVEIPLDAVRRLGEAGPT